MNACVRRSPQTDAPAIAAAGSPARQLGGVLEHRAVAGRPDLRDPGGRHPVLRRAEREAAQIPVDQRGRRRGNLGLDPRLGAVRFLRRELRQLQQNLRRVGRSHRVPAMALDHQPGSALRCRTGRRARAGTPTTGGHRRRTRSATTTSRQPGHRQKPGQRRKGRRTRSSATEIPRPRQLTPWPTRRRAANALQLRTRHVHRRGGSYGNGELA